MIATAATVNTAAIANTGCCQVAAVVAPVAVLPPRLVVTTRPTARSLTNGARAPLGLAAPRRARKEHAPAVLTAQNRAARAASRAVMRGPSQRPAGGPSPLRHDDMRSGNTAVGAGNAVVGAGNTAVPGNIA